MTHHAPSVSLRPHGRIGTRWHAAEVPPNGLEVSIEVGQIASAPGSITDRAAALLDPLRRVVPFQAACISLYDPLRQRYDALVTEGYDRRLREYFDSPVASTHVELLAVNTLGRVLPARRLRRPVADLRMWAEHLLPAGFREGMSVGLFAPDGRHLGMLALNTDTPAHPTDAACTLIERLAPVIANAIDPMRSITMAARMVRDAYAGIVLTGGGVPLPLPGLPSHRVLRSGSVHAVALERLARSGLQASFLCPYPGDAPPTYSRITVLAAPAEPYRHLEAVVLMSDPGHLAGLTPRELEVLGLIVDGWPNQRIAATLLVTERTVAAHVEHILFKLGAPTRTLAAVRALGRGMYLPRELRGGPFPADA